MPEGEDDSGSKCTKICNDKEKALREIEDILKKTSINKEKYEC